MNQIEIYQTKDKQTKIDVKFDGDTVWLDQQQLTQLFKRDRTVITKHINNIFKEGELEKESNVQKMHIPKSDKPIAIYSLDVIISVGYRVKSKQGIQFRQWATQRLKDHLVKGYTLNEKRLKQVAHNMQQLEQGLKLIQQSGKSEELNVTEAKGLLDIIAHYTQSFILLNQFDSDTLPDKKLNENITYEIEYKEAVKAIAELKKQLIKKKEASDLFGKKRDSGFQSSLNSVVQTFGGESLYKSIEEQAAPSIVFRN
jgi:hypothetical protein